MTSSPKAIVQVVENFNKSKLAFVQTIADLAIKPAYIECLRKHDVIAMAKPLVGDPNTTVKTNAVLFLSRMIGHSESCAMEVLNSSITLGRVFDCVAKENKYYKKNCMDFIRNICKYNEDFTKIVLTSGGMDAILVCIDDFDVLVREFALQAIASVARHGPDLSMQLVNTGLVPQILLCLKEQPATLKIASLAALDRIAKHNADLAQTIVTASALPYVVCLLSSTHTNIKVQRGALALIRNIVKHCLSLSENAIEADLFPTILMLMGSPDELIRTEAAKVVGEMVKQSVQISQLVVNAGGIAALMNVIKLSKEHCCLPSVIAIGYIAVSSPLLASVIIQSDVLLTLNAILENNDDEFLKAGVIWTLGLIGKHSTEHSRAVCTTSNVVCIMTEILKSTKSGPEIRLKAEVTLKLLLCKCDDLVTLNTLLTDATPMEIVVCVLEQFLKILPTNAKVRRNFILDGHLKRIQQYSPAPDTDMYRILQGINCCFPEDIVQRATGDFPESVMQTVDKYQPKSNCMFYSRHPKSNELNNSDNFSHEEEATFE